MWKARTMRRADRALPEAEALALAQRAEWGVLASADAEGAPLATPLSFVMMDGALYFHSAGVGHKLDNIAARPRVSFCVVGHTAPRLAPPHQFTTVFESVVLHGRASLVRDEAERRRALDALCRKYLPQHADAIPAALAASGAAAAVVRVDIDHLSGKARR